MLLKFLKSGLKNIIKLKKIFNKTQAPLGRWKLKSPEEIEYFMNRLHTDPGYPLKYYKTDVKK